MQLVRHCFISSTGHAFCALCVVNVTMYVACCVPCVLPALSAGILAVYRPAPSIQDFKLLKVICCQIEQRHWNEHVQYSLPA
jgi:hypothetical protein